MPVLYEENIPTLLAEINKRINEKVGQEYNFYIDGTVSDPAKLLLGLKFSTQLLLLNG